MLKIHVITLFPELIEAHLEALPFKRAVEKQKLEVTNVNLRDFALDSYGMVDDKPYGGGTGMILMIEPIFKALEQIKGSHPNTKKRIILLTPRGKTYSQTMAQDFSREEHLILICGRYEGVDARVEKYLATDNISMGDYVLSGGETPALAIMESVTRLLPGVLEKKDATKKESHTQNYGIEHPQYTRPEEFNGWSVPEILLSGHHKNIEQWKKQNAKRAETTPRE
jgi:tRNA (guanine37-N1)-methyltransferase